MPNITQIPAPRVPLIETNTGLISTQWFRYFNNINTIVGGGTGVTPPQSGGTGTSDVPVNGQILIGNNTGTYTVAYLTAGAGLTQTPGNGSLTVSLSNSGVTAGSYGSATQVGTFTVNAQGQVTLASNVTVTPAVASISGLGSGVAAALAVNVGLAGSFVLNGGALGTPSSGTVTNLTGTASININGTVGATTATTGAFTTLSATNQLTLTNASNYNLYASGAGQNYMLGALGIGAVPIAATANLTLAANITGAVTAYGVQHTSTIQSGVTNAAFGFSSSLSTQASAFTIANIQHYRAAQGTLGAGSAVTSQFGFVVGANLVGATTNYGFYTNQPTGANTVWSFYAAGTAPSLFAGSVYLGGVLNAQSLLVSPVAGSVNYLAISGSTGTTPTLSAAGTGADVDILIAPKGVGNVSFGTYTAGIVAQTGYITIKDAGGTARRLLVG